jgi:hypothetical protein
VNKVTPLPITAVTAPNPLWLTWADGLVAKAQENIQQQPEVLKWLADRGIDNAAVKRFGLGWLNHQEQVNRESIGLTKVKDDKTKLWVPDGLLIPIYDRNGQLHRLRVRRSPESREKFLPKLKYVWIDGSGTGPLVIRPAGPYRGVVIEEAELDTFATASAHDQVMVIGIGTVAAGLPAALKTELETASVILVALDADAEKDGKMGAGPKAFLSWKAAYRQAQFWTVPVGKDPGHYFQQGGDLKLWIEAGLPPVVTKEAILPAKESLEIDTPPQKIAHEQAFCPERAQRGGRGVDSNEAEKIDLKAKIETNEPISEPISQNLQIGAPQSPVDRILTAINNLPPLERSEVMSAWAIMQGHPVSGWLSPDGMDAGIIDATGDWRHRNQDLSDRFYKLFWGPGHGALCEIFKDQFIRNARIHKKCAFGRG